MEAKVQQNHMELKFATLLNNLLTNKHFHLLVSNTEAVLGDN